MIRIKGVRVNIEEVIDYKKVIAKRLKVNKEDIKSYKIHKKSIDARNKMMFSYVFDFDVEIDNEDKYLDNNIVKVELTDYVPTKDGVANINLKRTAFGLKFIVTPPIDGTLSVNPGRSYDNVYNGPDIKVSADESTLTFSSMYTFFQVYECWQMENYAEELTIQLTWKRANGATQTFEKTITVKRNVLTTVNVNVNGSSTDSSLGVKEDDTPMGNENVDMNFNGGDLDDNDVTPNV